MKASNESLNFIARDARNIESFHYFEEHYSPRTVTNKPQANSSQPIIQPLMSIGAILSMRSREISHSLERIHQACEVPT
jgi:hypothetical protein